jgi:hypothetical protein
LTRVDYLLFGSTLLVAAALICSVAGAFLMNRDRGATVARMDALARVLFPIGFLLLLGSVRLLG